MVKFSYNATPPAPVCIYTHPDLSITGTGEYRAVNAIVNEQGHLFVAAHWGNSDQLYVIKSVDNGSSWSHPVQISSGAGPWFYPHLEVTSANTLLCSYAQFLNGAHDIRVSRSLDEGLTWNNVLVSREDTSNPSILTVGDRRVFLFAQSNEESHRGLVYAVSENTGSTWSSWRVIDPTCGYADPSPALGSDGKTIYVAYRSSNGTGVTNGTCGDQCRSRLAMSGDSGSTWHFMDDYYEGERTGTRNQIRYQTWWNYGGPLEWIWMQYEDGGTNRPIYYDINTSVQIMNSNDAGSMNNAPVARAGADRTVFVNTPVDLDGTSSYDADGDTLHYSWSFSSTPDGSAAALVNSTSPRTSFTPDVSGTYVIRLLVNDGTVNGEPDTINIEVEEPKAANHSDGGGSCFIRTATLF